MALVERPVDYLHHIRAASDRLAAACEAAPGVPVPTCPDWTIERLVSHVGRLHRWVTDLNAASSLEAVPRPEVPPEDTDWPTWLRDGAGALVEALTSGDPEAPVWNPFGQPPTRQFWARRQAQETAVHAWDGDNAAATAAAASDQWDGPAPLDPHLAADGVDEMLACYLIPFTKGRECGTGETIHLHATDADLEWIITLGAHGIIAEPGHAKADVALRGPASALDLWAWNRLPAGADDIEVLGDAAVAAAWAKVARF